MSAPVPTPPPAEPATHPRTREDAQKTVPNRFSIPISLQILSWFSLNLLLVAIGGFLLLTSNGGPLMNVLISGKSGERLDAIAADVAERINGLPKEKWSGVLDNYSRRYKMAFAITRRDGDLQAGKVPPVPPSVAAKIREFPGTQRPPPPPFEGAGEPSPEHAPKNEGAPGLPRPHPTPLPSDPPNTDAPDLRLFRFIAHENNLYWIGVRVPFPSEAGKHRGPSTLLLVSSSLFSNGLLLDTTSLWIVAGVLLGSAIFWLPLVRRITVPLRRMRDTAELMAQGHFDTRIQIQRGDEIGSLGRSINHLGERLEEFVSGQKRFLGDIAHELGSPLARMQFGLGIMEQQANAPMQPLLDDVREEVAQMSALLQEILQFTRADLHTELHFEDVSLHDILLKVIAQESFTPAQITHQLPVSLCVHADAHLLQRAIANILRNAVRYAGHAGPVHLDAQATSHRVLLTVSDNGPGAPPELLHRLCDPFFRAESARTREMGGVGLGLAIVQRCVEACRGSLSIRNRKPSGLEVEIKLLPAGSKDSP